MNVLHQKSTRKRRMLKKQYLFILLILCFGIGFFVGKSYSAGELLTGSDAPSTMIESVTTTEELPRVPEPVDDSEVLSSNSEADSNGEFDKKEPIKEEVTQKKVVYLTFDDGPSKWTDQFLDILQAHDVKATFFMQGSNLMKENLQESVKRAVQEGHYIGGHSMTHNYKTLYTDEQFVPEMIETLDLIHEITGFTPHLVRPPYGSSPGLKSEQLRSQLANAHIKVWDWTIDSKDWELTGNPSQIVENIQQGTTSDREIVLMHEKSQTLEALPRILQFYKDLGYEFAVYEDTHHFTLIFQNDARL